MAPTAPALLDRDAGDTDRADGSIVVGIDDHGSSGEALDWAADQAAHERRPLTIVHSVPARWFHRQPRRDPVGLLEAASARVEARHHGLPTRQVGVEGGPRSALLHLSGEAAMVVVGSRGHGRVLSQLLGSVSSSLSSSARCPVVVLRPGLPAHPRHGVLVGHDGTPAADTALALAGRVALARTCPLVVLQVDPDGVTPTRWFQRHDGSAREHHEAGVGSAVAAAPGLRPHPLLRRARGRAEHHLSTGTWNYDLVVVSPSTAAGVLRHAHGPVAVVPS